MSSVLFDYPKKAFFGKTIPKTKFYEHGNVSNKLKELFVKQVDQIIWLYKLSPETINISSTQEVPEIQVFEIKLKGDDLSEDILLCIDRAVQYPIIFEVKSELGVRTVAAYKVKARSMRSDMWKIGHYLKTEIVVGAAKKMPLLVGMNLNAVYEQILVAISDIEIRKGESLERFIERGEEVQQKQSEISAIRRKIAVEKQFNKKVEFNSKLQVISDQLTKLLEKGEK